MMLKAGLLAVGLAFSQGITCFATPTEHTLHIFNPKKDGSNPEGVVIDSSGNVYGVSYSAGSSNYGTFFRYGANKTWRVLHTFTGGSDGGYPSDLLLTPTGALAGIANTTTSTCGGPQCVVVFQFSTTGTESTLAILNNLLSYGPLTVDQSNNLYLDADGYLYPEGIQSFVSLLPAGGGPLKSIYAFEYDDTGTILNALRYNNGFLYVATENGGGSCVSCPGNGALLKLSTSGAIELLYAFQGGADGADPNSLTFDQAGNIYGTTSSGGAYGLGTVFEYSSKGVKSILHSFAGGEKDGSNPTSIVVTSKGTIYGVTTFGGSLTNDAKGYGTVFKISPTGRETILHAFTGHDGEYPNGIVLNRAGIILGSTGSGGNKVGTQAGAGVLFEIEP